MRAPLALLLAMSAATAQAAPCYVFWKAECFEVRDPIRRDITHHVLLSADNPLLYEAAEGQCRAQLDRLIGEDGHRDILKRFNRVLEDIDGCRSQERLEPEVFTSGSDAYRRYRALDHESPIREVHRVRAPALR